MSAETLQSTTAASLAERVVAESALFDGVESPFGAAVEPGSAGLVVVTGENASGKSLYVRVMSAMAGRAGLLPISISIRERTGGGTFEMGAMRRSMMFGDEGEQSTGATSVGAVRSAFKNLDRPQGSLLILDEPEIGLSEGYARALGEYVGTSALEIPTPCVGVVVVTHSRPLVRGLLAGFESAPTHATVAAGRPEGTGIDRWLEDEEHRSVDELLGLKTLGLERWRRVDGMLAKKRRG